MSTPTLHRIRVRDGYYLAIQQDGHQWRYPVRWSKPEFQALRMLGRSQMETLDLELTGRFHVPRDVALLHELIENLFEPVVRLAAKAERLRCAPDVPPLIIPPIAPTPATNPSDSLK